MREEFRALPVPVSDRKRQLLLSLDVDEDDIGLPSGEIIGFGHTFRVPAGIRIGEPLRLHPYQQDFIRDVYNRLDPETRRRVVKQAFLSVARRNGKGLLAGVIVLAHLVGPVRKPNSLIMSAANDRDQAGVVFQFVCDLARTNPFITPMLKFVESLKRIVFPGMNSVYRCVSAEAKTKLGFGPDLIVYDEMGAAPKRDLYDALSTSLGSQPEPLLLGISTQAPDDAHFFSQLLDYGLEAMKGTVEDQTVIAHLHTTPVGADLFDEDAWRLSNPGLGTYRDASDLRSAITRAIRLPSMMGSIRNLQLNQRVAAHASLFDPMVWDKCAAAIEEEAFQEGEVWGGLDLSSRLDLTSFTMIAKHKGKVHVRSESWAPEENVDDRERRDRAPYREWVARGLITLTPGRVVDYSLVAARLIYLWQIYAFRGIAYDRWRIDALKKEVAEMGEELPLEPYGQGFKDMSPAIDALEALVVEGDLVHGADPLLRWAVGNVKVVADPANNRKLDKAKSYGRIDPAIALVMAVGLMTMKLEEGEADVQSLIA
ncbi:MAG: terminase large subunit [Pikeienuella sp.]|uniref:terminase large subunit n=1 Tax=Pikeienuella sp. TaxID=2831957 RepID=UPI003919E9CC